WSVSLEERMEKINQVIRGWSNYFRCAWMYKKNMRKLDSKLRRRIRAIIWKQWKSIRKKEESLIKLGCPRDKAHSYACARQGCVRCAVTCATVLLWCMAMRVWSVLSAAVVLCRCVMSILLHEGRAHDLIYNTMFV
ncbi:group II intron maturase-specific domain-containing protein, partial [Faecalibaculum rodentium]|uniref:group II intron maturase-specific domain-containing protein n=1 Tax=Faecalibaculum rodentium TaxID=1702221 RepID=UPI003365918F